MILPDDGIQWHVYPETNYKGKPRPVSPGHSYKDLASMGLDSPVMSMRKI